MEIGKRIKALRKFNGMTQLELGKSIGVLKRGDVRIAQYEGRYRTPSKNVIEKIAKELHANPRILLEMDSDARTEILKQLLWLDEETDAIQIIPTDLGMCIHIKDMDKAFAEWCGAKHLLAEGDISAKDYFAWKMNCPYLQ